ncbi:sensor histidine kinase [Streptomyces sp. AP-93]|uniref:sensor histidine kinase n=1 Tax=Streptomyces sp. AP-93 TaxID=2929048 RepID=UPI001FAFB3FE|nr:histidine kinase [Streptomyces sp. AP-93]MCJ0867908.1 histidine kinase [Streptomyces sp. AP-93]
MKITGMAHRDRAVVGVLTAACCAATLFLGVRPLPALAAAGIALAAFGCLPRSRGWTGTATGGAGALLLVAAFGWPGRGTAEGAPWHMVAVGAVLLLLTAAVRWAPRRQLLTGGGLGAVAVAAWTLPLVPDASFFERLGLMSFWSAPIAVSVVVGGYPRLMEDRRRQAVLAARRAQQLELAHDLHDFVAHDVSGIVVQAQAARFVAQHDPAAAARALERIERAGLAALASIDRTVRMLHAADENTGGNGDGDSSGLTGDEAARGARTVLPGIGQLGEVVDRFSETGRIPARLDLAPDVTDVLSREGAATVHRVVVEALTNVRRHAPGAAGVRVELGTDRTTVEVKVTNGGGRGRSSHLPALSRLERGARGGGGLLALAERVRASGGTFASGPYQDGWRVTATLPATTGPHATAS